MNRIVIQAVDAKTWLGRRVTYLVAETRPDGTVVRTLSRRTVRVPSTSPVGAYAGPDVRRGLEAAQRLGLPFDDRSHFPARGRA
jgi:hypothetical protein